VPKLDWCPRQRGCRSFRPFFGFHGPDESPCAFWRCGGGNNRRCDSPYPHLLEGGGGA